MSCKQKKTKCGYTLLDMDDEKLANMTLKELKDDSIYIVEGPRGPIGNQGPCGPKGCSGKRGKRGCQGPKGDIGPQGIAGPSEMYSQYFIRIIDASNILTTRLNLTSTSTTGTIGNYVIEYSTSVNNTLTSIGISADSTSSPTEITFYLNSLSIIGYYYLTMYGNNTIAPITLSGSNTTTSKTLTYDFTDNTTYQKYIYDGAVIKLYITWLLLT